MILHLTLFQRFNLENVLNQQEPKPQRDQFLLWGLLDKIGFSRDEEKLHTRIAQGPFNQEVKRLSQTAVEDETARDFEISDAEKALLDDVFKNWKFSGADRAWARGVGSQL
jgi:hypothetical protein